MNRLESRYRRWLVCYPKSFRAGHEAELLAVLIAVSRDGQQHPAPGELLALLKGGLGMRLLPDLPRSARLLRAAAGLLCLAAALEIATWCAVLATRNSVVARLRAPASLVPDLVAAPLVVIALLVLAWAIGHRRRWGPGGLIALTLLTTIGLLSAVSQGATTYAPVDVITGALAWATTLTAAILIAVQSTPRPATT